MFLVIGEQALAIFRHSFRSVGVLSAYAGKRRAGRKPHLVFQHFLGRTRIPDERNAPDWKMRSVADLESSDHRCLCRFLHRNLNMCPWMPQLRECGFDQLARTVES